MVMIGAGQINNTINESTITLDTIKQRQQQQSNAITAPRIMIGSSQIKKVIQVEIEFLT